MTDLQKFLKIFNTDRYKIIKGGKCAELRVSDYENQKQQAQIIIDSNGLDLKVVSNAIMASYRAFEVWEGSTSS